MWKYVSRGIRETLERRTCRTNVYSQTSQDNNTKNEVKSSLTCNHKFVSPIAAYNKGFCGSAKAGGAKDKDYDSKWNAKHTWQEAVGWSSVLAVGWVVCQTLCLRRRLFENKKNESIKSKISQLSEARISYLFGQVLNLKPKHVLPITNCVGSGSSKYVTEERDIEWKSEKPFGPITIEEALKEASEEFANTHKLVIGELELRYGIRALDEKRYKDALNHFAAGARLSSPSSMFNLGLCYELGIGTIVDQTKAAKYYRDAAEQGHADAIYNLGVFYAQGRGGFSVNTDRARDYFIKAAELGQTQAQCALNLEKNYNKSRNNNNTDVFQDSRQNSIQYTQSNKTKSNILKKLVGYNTTLNNSIEPDSIPESSNYKESLVEDKNPTEIFLEFLGLNEPSPVRVAAFSSDSRVPC